MIVFENMSCPRPQKAFMILRAWPGYRLSIDTITMLWKMPAAGKCMSTISGSVFRMSGQEYPFARFSEIVILHRRDTDDGREVDRLLAPGHAGEMEHRVVVGMGIEAGVIAERPLAATLTRLDVALEDDLRVGRDFEIDRHALDDLDALPC